MIDLPPADLHDQVAVVTGGGRGLERAFAQALPAAGCSVAVIARSAAELAETVTLIEQSGGQARAMPADVTDPAVLGDAFARIVEQLGPIDLLVNNAGVLGPLGPFALGAVDDWWHAVDANLRGQILCAHRVLPGMITRRRGRIINIVNGGGATMLPYFSAYITNKTALIRFSECLAFEVKPHGISVFAMGPGTVRTAMSEYSLNSLEGKTWRPWFRDIFDAGRDLPPARPAALLLALASGRADALYRDASRSRPTISIRSSTRRQRSRRGSSIPSRCAGYEPSGRRQQRFAVASPLHRPQPQFDR